MALEEKHNTKFRHFGHTTSQYGPVVSPKIISAMERACFREGSVIGYI